MKDGKRLVVLSFVLCFALSLFSPIKAHAFFDLFEEDTIAIVKDNERTPWTKSVAFCCLFC